MRDDFPSSVKEQVAKRAGMRCSNPECRQPTSGPRSEDVGSASIGVAAHITAAAPLGPRYDQDMSGDERASADNAIWLCENCAKLVDADISGHATDKIREWKAIAEKTAYLELKGWRVVPDTRQNFANSEKDMPELIGEMRKDLKCYPLQREFYLKECSIVYNMSGFHLAYFYDDHKNLRQMIRILENHRLVADITATSVERFLISEDFAEFLKSERSPDGAQA
jgi:hypothetical protein